MSNFISFLIFIYLVSLWDWQFSSCPYTYQMTASCSFLCKIIFQSSFQLDWKELFLEGHDFSGGVVSRAFALITQYISNLKLGKQEEKTSLRLVWLAETGLCIRWMWKGLVLKEVAWFPQIFGCWYCWIKTMSLE